MVQSARYDAFGPRPCVVIFCDDNALARDTASDLGSKDLEIVILDSLADAAATFARSFPTALIVSSERLETHQCLRQELGDRPLPVLVLADDSHGSAAKIWRHGADVAVLQKPVPSAEVVCWLKGVKSTPRADSGPALDPGREALSHLRGGSAIMRSLREQIARVSGFATMPVLVTGETGTGKELVARAIHQASCPHQSFVTLNCAAIPEGLFEANLFGHAPGAFTNATGRRSGLFEEAGSGVLFLDEVGEMPPSLQPKLLRALETRRFRPVGSQREFPFRARIVSATNVALAQASGLFRADLYFRLAGLTIHVPPLRDRKEDLQELAQSFLNDFCCKYSIEPLSFEPAALAALHDYSWPGNVRELRALVETAAVNCRDSVIRVADLRGTASSRTGSTFPPPSTFGRAKWSSRPPLAAELTGDEMPPQSVGVAADPAQLIGEDKPFRSLAELERHVILTTYRQLGRNLSSTSRTLSVPRSTLRDKLKRWGEELDGEASSSRGETKVAESANLRRRNPSRTDP